jgi:PTH1 family peptidyl-tRNA hydrolase
MMTKFLIVGLGNPGAEYADTRHNIGYDVANAFAAAHGANFQTDRLAYKAEFKWKAKTFICICPTTYMNLSGRAFRYWMDKEKIALENTLTIVDDIALPLEKVRLRAGGSHAGHNGLRDIQDILGTTDYPKLRFGIGSHFPKGMQSDFVLGKWSNKETDLVKIKISKCVEVIESYATIGLERTMSLVNNLSFTIP